MLVTDDDAPGSGEHTSDSGKEKNRKTSDGGQGKKLRSAEECFALAERLGKLRERMPLSNACSALGISRRYAAQLLPLLALDPAVLRYVRAPVPAATTELVRARNGRKRSGGRLTWGVGLLIARLPKEHQHALAMTILAERLSEKKARRLVSAYREKHGIRAKRGNPVEGTALRKLERAALKIECLFSDHIERIPLLANVADGEPPERLHALAHTLRMIELHAAALRSALAGAGVVPVARARLAAV